MKKLLAILIILSTLLTFVACSGDKPGDTPPDEIPPTFAGASITEYTIVYDEEGLDYNKRAAEYIRDRIHDFAGYSLLIVDDSEPKKDREIIVGETSRELSQKLDEDTEGLEFAILKEGGCFALEADYFVIAAAAYYFVDTYFAGRTYDSEIPDGLTVREPITKEAKNLILLIGDGMGVYQTKLFDYLEDTSDYSDGEDIFYGYMLPYHGFSRTNSYTGVTDSAAGGTALACGYKTNNSYLGLDKDGNEIKSLTELAAELGKSTAVMSTENKTGATPSSFSSHTDNRSNTDEILEDQLNLFMTHGTIVECGYDYYDANRVNKSIEKRITNTLGQLSLQKKGFFVMYEEAHIDKKCHNNDMESTFLALLRFNQAIARFMEFAFYNPDTAVLITADHETGGLLPTEDGALAYNTDEHTSANVPIFAYGEGFESLDGQTVENIEIAKLYASLMGVEDFGDPSDDWRDASQ